MPLLQRDRKTLQCFDSRYVLKDGEAVAQVHGPCCDQRVCPLHSRSPIVLCWSVEMTGYIQVKMKHTWVFHGMK